jgi:hypothetical protein
MVGSMKEQCDTGTDVCPDLVPVEEFGHHSSFVIVPGVRRWEFTLPAQRDAFLQAVEQGRFRRAMVGRP